jgi:plastocyanin
MRSGRAAVAVLFAVALAGVTAGCSSGSSSSSKGSAPPFVLTDKPVATNRVELPKSYKFQPPVIEVKRGTTVTWVNHDDFPHTVQILAGADTGTHDLGIGKTVTIAFDRPGTVYYHCSLHPAQMKGEIVVTS